MASRTIPFVSPRVWTLAGLTLALFALPMIALGYRMLVPAPSSAGPIVIRELIMFGTGAVLLWIAFAKERLSPEAIGFGRDRAWRTVLWGVSATLLCVAAVGAGLAVASLLGLQVGGDGRAYVPPLWATSLVVVRAGILEELFYRGYAIARLTALTGSRTVAATLPLAIFTLGHYHAGVGTMLLVFVLGAVITAFYLWRRNLVANMIAHVLIDAVPNVLVPLVSGTP